MHKYSHIINLLRTESQPSVLNYLNNTTLNVTENLNESLLRYNRDTIMNVCLLASYLEYYDVLKHILLKYFEHNSILVIQFILNSHKHYFVGFKQDYGFEIDDYSNNNMVQIIKEYLNY